MIIVIIAIILLVAGVGLHFLIKKERKRQAERRAIKVKIAAGDFDAVLEDTPSKKKKKVRKPRKGDKDWKDPVPDYVMADLEKTVPGLVQRMYEQVRALQETAAAAHVTGAKLSRAKAKVINVTYPVGESAQAQNTWMSHAHSLRLAVEELAPEHCTTSSAFSRAYGALRSSSDQADKLLKSVESYDQTTLPQDLTDLVDILRVLKSELPFSSYKVNSEDLTLPPEYNVKRQCTDLLTLDLVEIFENELGRMFPLAARLTVTRLALNDATAVLKTEVAAGVIPEPEKPTDAEVQQYIARAEAWSTKVQKARELVEVRLKEMEEAQRQFDDFMPELQLASEQANEIALDGGKNLASPALQRCNIAFQALVAFAPYAKPALDAACHALNNDHSVFIVSVEAEGAVAEGEVADAAVAPEEGEEDLDEAALTVSLRSALRKLGFAVAQRGAAQGKVDTTMAQGLPPADQYEPRLDETSGESYLRRYSQWQRALADQNIAGEARKERLTAFTEQATARTEQVKAAALVLDEQLVGLTQLEDMSRELDILARAANLLCKKYK